MLKTAVGRFRVVSLLEGLSFLILLFIAMPIKYVGGWDTPVAIVGAAHGGLFVLYMLALLLATIQARWNLKRVIIGVIVSFVPFGTFWFDKQIRQDQA
ncbi:integral membrane protein [Paenibacillaceae bacterium GAS479]|nr:integral membrane protein [Paenibacillaceae bacterium GAS479]